MVKGRRDKPEGELPSKVEECIDWEMEEFGEGEDMEEWREDDE